MRGFPGGGPRQRTASRGLEADLDGLHGGGGPRASGPPQTPSPLYWSHTGPLDTLSHVAPPPQQHVVVECGTVPLVQVRKLLGEGRPPPTASQRGQVDLGQSQASLKPTPCSFKKLLPSPGQAAPGAGRTNTEPTLRAHLAASPALQAAGEGRRVTEAGSGSRALDRVALQAGPGGW